MCVIVLRLQSLDSCLLSVSAKLKFGNYFFGSLHFQFLSLSQLNLDILYAAFMIRLEIAVIFCIR